MTMLTIPFQAGNTRRGRKFEFSLSPGIAVGSFLFRYEPIDGCFSQCLDPLSESYNRYLMLFRCPNCQVAWQDEWDCACNDRCPGCRQEIAAYDTVLIHDHDLDSLDFAGG